MKFPFVINHSKTRTEEAISAEQMGRAIFEVLECAYNVY